MEVCESTHPCDYKYFAFTFVIVRSKVEGDKVGRGEAGRKQSRVIRQSRSGPKQNDSRTDSPLAALFCLCLAALILSVRLLALERGPKPGR